LGPQVRPPFSLAPRTQRVVMQCGCGLLVGLMLLITLILVACDCVCGSCVRVWLCACVCAFRASGCQRDYDCGAAVNSVALHPNQAELICGLQNGNIRVWDLAENKCTEYVRHTTQGTGDTTRHTPHGTTTHHGFCCVISC
jgi:WD40 repeat protein